MAYTFFPKTATEINKELKNSDKDKVNEIISLFTELKSQYKTIESPINIDPKNISKVNITRMLQGEFELSAIKRKIKLTKIAIKFGSGSSGNRGVANRGNLFEPLFADSLARWWAGEDLSDNNIKEAIDDIVSEYNLDKKKDLKIETVGELNNPRPLIFSGDQVSISSKIPISDDDLGPIVSDITLTYDKTKKIYLSLKLGKTTTFFNCGIRTILTPTEIKSGKITNDDGLKLLNMFNIHPALFCDIFNGKLEKGYSEDVWKNITGKQKILIQRFLETGIGHGYQVVHKLDNRIKTYKIDKKYMQNSSKPMSCILYYGGKKGKGKRIDIEIETPKYTFKLNIRDTQGNDGYPTRIMGDFSYK